MCPLAAESKGKGFRDIPISKTRFHSTLDNVNEEVLIPALKAANSFRCMVGYFGSGALQALAPGLAEFIFESENPVQLLVSPQISLTDQEALQEGLERSIEVAEKTLKEVFTSPETLNNDLAHHTKKCLAYLIATQRLEMKIVLVRGGLFHLKEWILTEGQNTLVLSGSANFSGQALPGGNNHETLWLSRSWENSEDQKSCADSSNQFEEYWNNQSSDDSVTLPLSGAINESILRHEDARTAPTPEDFRRAVKATAGSTHENRLPKTILIPSWLVYDKGDFSHQGTAITAWEENDRSGILAIATGGGKTITSLIAAARLSAEKSPLLLLIAVPTKPLFTQWCEEVEDFGLTAPFGPDSTRKVKFEESENCAKRLFYGVSSVEVIILTIDLLCDSDFQNLIRSYQLPTMLIADEVHNFATQRFLENAPSWIRYRLGLSATPVKQYDEEGTKELFDYFSGGTVFEFSLEEAIGNCLTEYDYFLHPVELSLDEMDKWVTLSEKIRKAFQGRGDVPTSEEDSIIQALLNRRRKIIETAEQKLEILRDLLESLPQQDLDHTLIYATDKDPEQLLKVGDLLNDLGVSFHQVTQEETRNSAQLKSIIDTFRSRDLSVLTAKRVLDEGFNVPEIKRAFILASTTTTKQWTQRRGRVLRKCKDKTNAEIHDFLVLPPAEDFVDEGTRKLVRGELKRCEEFARLSRNQFSANGSSEILNDARIRFS
jgi:superfamily II DNA or RNA helicase